MGRSAFVIAVKAKPPIAFNISRALINLMLNFEHVRIPSLP
jgi:hypothetical protein